MGNVMHPNCTIFSTERKLCLTLHTKAELLDLFKEYESISLEEVKIVVPLRGTDRYFEVLAKKRKNRI